MKRSTGGAGDRSSACEGRTLPRELSAPPTEIDWSALSPQAREIAQLVALRLVAGMSLDEIAVILDEHRGRIRHNELPRADSITKNWCASRMRDLRREIEATAGGDG